MRPDATAPRLLARLALAAILVLPTSGCSGIADFMFGKRFPGPPPAEEGITGELAIVRQVEVTPNGYTILLIDRVRYLEAGDPHNVNRVARLVPAEEMRAEVAALDLARGDRVLVTTDYQRSVVVVGSLSIPDWPGHGAYEYPIGLHSIRTIERAGT